MGSPLRLVMSSGRIDHGWRLVTAHVRRIARSLTRFDPCSPLSRLNRAAGSGSWMDVPVDLRRALAAAERGYRATDGRFDPRIVGVLEALGDRAGVRLPPSPVTLRPGDTWLELDRSGRCARLGSPVDLGGLGKGFALAAGAAALEAAGIDSFLIESGGDVVVLGRPPDADAWSVAVEHPARDLPLAIVHLDSGSMATSSDAVRQWTGPAGTVRHHLIDPATGAPAVGVASVTVHAEDPVEAEIRSTAAFIGLGRADARSLPAAAWWVLADREVHRTPAAECMTAWP